MRSVITDEQKNIIADAMIGIGAGLVVWSIIEEKLIEKKTK